jgi:hypothetical protein
VDEAEDLDSEEITLNGGPCCGDTATVAIGPNPDVQMRLIVLKGICLDHEMWTAKRGSYSEALYARMSDGKWWYIGRFRVIAGGEVKFYEG